MGTYYYFGTDLEQQATQKKLYTKEYFTAINSFKTGSWTISHMKEEEIRPKERKKITLTVGDLV